MQVYEPWIVVDHHVASGERKRSPSEHSTARSGPSTIGQLLLRQEPKQMAWKMILLLPIRTLNYQAAMCLVSRVISLERPRRFLLQRLHLPLFQPRLEQLLCNGKLVPIERFRLASFADMYFYILFTGGCIRCNLELSWALRTKLQRCSAVMGSREAWKR